MKYPYAVKANGKWYRPNEEVPDNESANQRGIPLVKEVRGADETAENADKSVPVEDVPAKRRRKATK